MFYSKRNARKSKAAQEFIWPAPVGGLIRAGNAVGGNPAAAEVLTNFIPTADGARLRGGSVKFATIDAAVREILTYRSGTAESMFAASDTQIHNVSAPADPDVAGVPAVRGLGSGAWSYTQFANSAGQFLVAVNGTDYMHYYNGTGWNVSGPTASNNLNYDGLTTNFTAGATVTGGTSGATATIYTVTPATATTGTLKVGTITGVFLDNETITGGGGSALVNGATAAVSPAISTTVLDTRTASFVWHHKRRLWFVREQSLDVYYLPIDSIGGAAVLFTLKPLFKLGGELVFGGTWSVDAGSGPDDLIVFVTSEGEIAVYQGTDPATDFKLVGVYQIGKPLNKRGWFDTGADLAVLTKDSIVPISGALEKELTALQAAAISAPIETLWRDLVAQDDTSFDFSVTTWPSRTVALVGAPGEVLVVNTRTGAWAEITGWDVQCSAVFGDELFFGTSDGTVVQADVAGTDQGGPYTGYYVPKFQEFGTLDDKVALHAKTVYRSKATSEPQLVCFQNYTTGEFAVSGGIVDSGSATWGVFVWGEGVWGAGSSKTVTSEWQAVSGLGFSLSVAMSITSSQLEQPEFDILATGLRYEVGRSI